MVIKEAMPKPVEFLLGFAGALVAAGLFGLRKQTIKIGNLQWTANDIQGRLTCNCRMDFVGAKISTEAAATPQLWIQCQPAPNEVPCDK